ncbi:serine/threonine-protein kinase atg1-like [Gossypium australe]|uniref:Serine/threonine-protein kinase atg1-like n=1 Tax=Gossypium australe TaxID=47621 RepID=A0A5B6UVX9_9ROSI|nr:serine/threonine-protein kinase atg1-like [Gossypium australe]
MAEVHEMDSLTSFAAQYHPNFPYNNQWAGHRKSSMPSRPSHPLEYSQQVQQPPQTKSSSNLENLLKVYIAKNDMLIQSKAKMLNNLGNQVGQLANELRIKPQGVLPSNTKNLRSTGKEHCKVLTLRSGKTLEPKVVEFEGKLVVTQNKEEIQPDVGIPTLHKSFPATENSAPETQEIVLLQESK